MSRRTWKMFWNLCNCSGRSNDDCVLFEKLLEIVSFPRETINYKKDRIGFSERKEMDFVAVDMTSAEFLRSEKGINVSKCAL